MFLSFFLLIFSDRVLDAEEKLLLAQGARERAEIVEKYDKVAHFCLKINLFKSILKNYF